MEPQLVFPPMSYAEVQNTWSEPIDIVHRAIIGFTEDIAMFQKLNFHKRHTEAGEEFLRSLLYYSQVLVLGSLVKIKGGLHVYAYTPASPSSEPTQSIGSRLTDAQVAFDGFFSFTADVLIEASWTFSWKTPSAGEDVPTASPYQLLYEMICVEKLSSAPADHMMDVLCMFYRPWQGSFDEITRKFT